MLTVTLVRHGESEDNPKAIWAGWKDAPLSQLGRRQAAAVGAFFRAHTLANPAHKPHTIYASPLLRARETGQAIRDSQPHPKPEFVVNPDLREQYFGIAEGHPWTYQRPDGKSAEQLISEGIYPVLFERHEKFPEGESSDDLRIRTDRVVRECIVPHLGKDVAGDRHIVMASHGLCIAELVASVIKLDPSWPVGSDDTYRGMLNTAWARLEIDPHEDGGSSYKVRVTHFNEGGHLKDLDVPTASEPDPETDDTANAEARAFFSGGLKVEN
ncbi:hypothetical protein D9758_003066 [Tetrapyrgos nigripes]|uniref:Phosphoglycerate mutase n=1 Tax=Tetrapyrgos nigripes TaxID=182062 RepID=A0A8H5GPQ4_9AGAR|nr:hypothetical protein D9758_003066 [Tetrapyrgos nigripes]